MPEANKQDEMIEKLILENKELKDYKQEREAAEGEIESLNAAIAQLGVEKDRLNIEKAKEEAENLAQEAVRKTRMDVVSSAHEEQVSGLDEERAKIESMRAAMARESADLEASKREMAFAADANKRVKEELEAREREAKYHGDTRSSELASIVQAKKDMEIERIKLDAANVETIARVQENRDTLASIEAAREWSEKLMQEITKERQACEDRRLAAQNEIAAASYMLERSKEMLACYRQMLNSYIIQHGSDVTFPEMTDEIRRFIAQDLLSQCTTDWPIGSVPAECPIGERTEMSKVENPEPETDMSGWTPTLVEGDGKIDISDITHVSQDARNEARELYVQKFGKNPFMGWTTDELMEKINA